MGTNYDCVVIDSRGSLSGTIPAALRVADLILTPIQASPLDVRANADLVDVVQACQKITDGRVSFNSVHDVTRIMPTHPRFTTSWKCDTLVQVNRRAGE